MKQIAIRKIFCSFYSSSDEIESNEYDEKLEKLDHEMKQLFQKYEVKPAEFQTYYYGLEKYSIYNCAECGRLIINRDKNPAGFEGSESSADIENVISNGGEMNGKLLCEECLPVTHRWGLHI